MFGYITLLTFIILFIIITVIYKNVVYELDTIRMRNHHSFNNYDKII